MIEVKYEKDTLVKIQPGRYDKELTMYYGEVKDIVHFHDSDTFDEANNLFLSSDVLENGNSIEEKLAEIKSSDKIDSESLSKTFNDIITIFKMKGRVDDIHDIIDILYAFMEVYLKDEQLKFINDIAKLVDNELTAVGYVDASSFAVNEAVKASESGEALFDDEVMSDDNDEEVIAEKVIDEDSNSGDVEETSTEE